MEGSLRWLERLLLAAVIAGGAVFIFEFLKARRIEAETAAREAPSIAAQDEILARIDTAKKAENAAMAKMGRQARAARMAVQDKQAAVNAARMAALRANPEYQALAKKYSLRLAGVTYTFKFKFGYLAGALGLPPDKEARLRELMVEMDSEHMTVPWGRSYPIDGQIRDLLGADGFSQFKVAEVQAQTAFTLDNTFGFKLTQAGMPLSPDEMKALVGIATQVQAAANGTRTIDPQTGLDASTLTGIEMATKVLTPAQMEIVRNAYIEAAQPRAMQQQLIDSLRASGQIGPNDSGNVALYGAAGVTNIPFSPRQ